MGKLVSECAGKLVSVWVSEGVCVEQISNMLSDWAME